ncbi:glycosyltransferase [Bacillus toyonensis]|uniref:glycosyltransferase n=1 Tax=Bacillus toyonensis TaxID=155322 RepID=UPI000BFD0570|nr:glycosyltransferase [Bacillus toyonensis]PHG66539.1 glycosyl transferase [Bacillus toyonensis]
MVTISLCMIVKNEEGVLNRCLQSVKGIPDEIIIVDTGSTDATKKIAKKWTKQVYDFKWIYDFSAARNEAFSYATKEYIFWLDADDILMPEEVQKLHVLKNALNLHIDAVSMNYHADFDTQGNVTGSVIRNRLFKREKQYQWTGVVHEHIDVAPTDTIWASDVVVTHRPKNNERSVRNLDLYERYLKRGGTLTPHDLFHYGRELSMHERYMDAITVFEQYLETPEIVTDIRLFVLNELASCYFFIQDIQKEEQISVQSLLYDLPQPIFCCRLGEAFLRKGIFQTAIFWYEIALQVPVTYSWSMDKIAFRTWFPHKQLGVCYEQLDELEKAIHHYEQVLTYLPEEESQRKLQKLRKK